MEQTTLSRRQTLGLLGASTASLALTACQTTRALSAAPAISPQAFLDELAWKLLELSPESATSLGIDKGSRAGLRFKLGDRSQAGQDQIAAVLRQGLKQLTTYEGQELDPATGTSVAVVKSAFSVALDGFALPYGDVAVGGWRNTPYVVIQNVGAYLDIPRFLDSEHPVKEEADAHAYISRLDQFSLVLDGELERLVAAGQKGAIAPTFLLDKAIRQMEMTLKDAEAGGGLVDSLVRRTAGIPGNWTALARAHVVAGIAENLALQLRELKSQRAKASDHAGLWARPHGDEWYAWGLRASTTTRRTPEEVHAIGLESVKELNARMDPILRGLGYTKGTVGERMAGLGSDPRFQFPNTDAGRAEVIATMQGKIDFIRTKLPQAFRTLVKGNLVIKRLPPAEEDGAPGAYGGAGSIDGTEPGKIWLNLGDVSRHSRYGVATLAFHEGIPGHVWQGEYANRLPLIRTLLAFNAYSEGWALYAETLGDELGAYEGDPVGQLGYLQSIAFRACRLVVDTGLHAKRWTREQAVQWFASTNGSGLAEVAPEVDRYCSWPGQACGYKMGHSEILRLREHARAELGAKYDLRDFDDAVVTGGNVPLDVLGRNVERYIAAFRP
jgi:uncharacterized protein (DUF885 family)